MAKKTLQVYPNPFIHLDHDGVPAGACCCDMPEHVGLTSRLWVGAEIDKGETKSLETISGKELAETLQYRDMRQQTRFKFNFDAPTMLPITEYYKDRLRHGEIIAADKATAAIGGTLKRVERKDAQGRVTGYDLVFEEPKAVLERSKAEAVKRWAAENGPDEKPEFVNILDEDIAKIGQTPSVQAATRVASELAKEGSK